MDLEVIITSPQTEGFSRLVVYVNILSFEPPILDQETLSLKTEASVVYDLISSSVEREDDTVIEFDEGEEDEFYSILSIEDQKGIEEKIIEELEYTYTYLSSGD